MTTLTFTYKGKEITAKLEVKEKHYSEPDYILTGKNGYSLYYFRKQDGIWTLAYGEMPSDLRDIIIAALIARFDPEPPKI
jgi:hypothetical protein